MSVSFFLLYILASFLVSFFVNYAYERHLERKYRDDLERSGRQGMRGSNRIVDASGNQIYYAQGSMQQTPTLRLPRPVGGEPPAERGNRAGGRAGSGRSGSGRSGSGRTGSGRADGSRGPVVISQGRNRPPDSFPACPVCRCRNRLGQPQLVFMEAEEGKWRCHNGHSYYT